MADHPVENTIEIIVKDGTPSAGSSTSSSPARPAPMPDELPAAAAPQKQPRDQYGRFQKRSESSSGGSSGSGSRGSGRGAGGGPPDPVPPPDSGGGDSESSGHPDDPPANWTKWRDVTDARLRRRYWIERRRRINNSMSMQERQERARQRAEQRDAQTVKDVPENFQPGKSPARRRDNWKQLQKRQRSQQSGDAKAVRKEQLAQDRAEKQQARRQQRRQRTLRGVPKSFQPNVRSARKRRDNWKAYLKNKKQEQSSEQQKQKLAERTSEKQQKSFQKRQEQQKKAMARDAARKVAKRSAFGRAIGSSWGAGLGAKFGGPMGAAVGSQVGGAAGARIAASAATALPAMAAVSVVAVAALTAKKLYDVYDKGHQAFNEAIADGLVPFTTKLAEGVPIVGNFVGTLNAINRRFTVDADRYRSVAPRLMTAERISQALTAINRAGLAHERGLTGGGRSLDEQMSEMARLRGRFTNASETVDAAFSRLLYSRLLPTLEKGVTVLERLAVVADPLLAGGERMAIDFAKTFAAVISAEAKLFGGPLLTWLGGKALEDFGKIVAAADKHLEMAAEQKRKENAALARILADKVQSNLTLLFHGVGGPKGAQLTPAEQQAFRRVFKQNRPPRPPGLPGMVP